MRYGRHLLAVTVGASLAFSAVGLGAISVAPVAQAQAVEAGTMAVVDVDFLNVRQTPSLSGAIVTTLAFGDEVEVVAGPTAADGYDWYQVQRDGASLGWSVAGFLRLADGEVSTPVVNWTYGDTVIINTDFLNVRATPSTSGAILDVYEFGFEAIITGDATSAGGIVWYPVDNIGWVAGQYLSSGSGGGGSSAGDWVYGDVVIVNTDRLNVRQSPSITASILAVYVFGDEATVTGDAVSADGITWYPVNELGWVSGEFLADGAGTTDPSGDFVYGDVVVVNTDLLNVRALPSLTAGILDVYPQGTEATITGDATPADGITWYPVDDLGWVAGQYLALVSSSSASSTGSAQPSGSTAPVPSASATSSSSGTAQPSGSTAPVPSASPASSDETAFVAGDTVTVSAARLNVRAAASSTGAILRIVDFGAGFTIVGDAVTVNGVDWYNVGTVDDEAWVVGDFLTLAGE